MRPPVVWNFTQDASEDRIPHVLRAKANPVKCYEDGRIEKIQEAITAIGFNLTKWEEAQWNLLTKYTLDVFRALNKKYQASLNEDK